MSYSNMHLQELFIIIILSFCANTIICGVYDYKVFESSEQTKDIFVKEQQLLKEFEKLEKLYQYHIDLVNTTMIEMIKAKVKLHKKATNVSSEVVKNPIAALRTIERTYKWKHKLFIEPKLKRNSSFANFMDDLIQTQQNMEKLLPFLKDLYDDAFIGTVRGIMMIQETYDLNLTEFATGKIFLDQEVSKKFSSASDYLDPTDLANIANIAFKMKWYDTALKYLRESVISYEQLPLEAKNDVPPWFINTLHEMKKNFTKVHNKSLLNKKKRVGEDWKLFPYLIDEGLFAKL